MKPPWTCHRVWLLGFLTGLVAAVLLFQFRPAQVRSVRPASPLSEPRWIQTPAKSRAAALFKATGWQGASTPQHLQHKENVPLV